MRIFQTVRARAGKLPGHRLERVRRGRGQRLQPLPVFVGKRPGALDARARGQAVAEFGQHVVKVVIVHVVEPLHEQRGAPGVGQAAQHLAALGRFNPAGAEIFQRRRFPDQPRRQPFLVFLHRHRHGPAVHLRHDVAPGGAHAHVEAFDLNRRFGRLRRFRAGTAFARLPFGFEFPAEQPRGVGEIINAEHQFAGGRIEPRAAPDHLVKRNRRADVFEENDVLDGGHVHAGREQVNGGRNEKRAGRAAQIGEVLRAADAGGAFEGVVVKARPVVHLAPIGVKIAHRGRHIVRVAVAGAKDDGLLLRPARGEKLAEKEARHGGDTFGNEQFGIKFSGGVM